MSDIPQAREELLALERVIKAQVQPAELAEALVTKSRSIREMMIRRRHKSAAPSTARKMTPALAGPIKAYKARHPQMKLEEIGLHFKLSMGRVSEALHGDWDPGGPKFKAYVEKHGRDWEIDG
jgi:hypothetical protein